MREDNYTNAQNNLLKKESIKSFIEETTKILKQKCREGVDYVPFVESYKIKLKEFNLTRLESFIIINELRYLLEDDNGYACSCIDSFIDRIYTGHTGDISFKNILRFKNEPEDPKLLIQYIERDVWMDDTSWEKDK